MVQSVHGLGGRVVPPVLGSEVSQAPEKVREKEKKSFFREILGNQLQQLEDIKFSAHAQERIRLRKIELSENEVGQLKSAVDQIAEKGGRESLVLMSNSAFLVSVKNRTVITAIGSESIKNNVFTNIDSAVVI